MAVTANQKSRLRFAELVLVDGVEFWDLIDFPELPSRPDDILHPVIDTDRIDLLAYKYYGSTQLWWVIALANNLDIVPTLLNVGDTIRIPAPNYVQQTLFTDVKF